MHLSGYGCYWKIINPFNQEMFQAFEQTKIIRVIALFRHSNADNNSSCSFPFYEASREEAFHLVYLYVLRVVTESVIKYEHMALQTHKFIFMRVVNL